MMTAFRSTLTAVVVSSIAFLSACQQTPPDDTSDSAVQPADDDQEEDLWAALNEVAIVDQMVMMPMRDGVRLATHIYRPKTSDGSPVPTIFVKTPYNMNPWGDGEMNTRRLRRPLEAVRHGYAYVNQNERGKFFSEGEWDILGPPKTDGYDALTWISEQAWSNGKVGTYGCSSTAEWQMGLASLDHPAHTAMVPQGFGAGVGRIGDWYEQGNWYRGGAEQMLFFCVAVRCAEYGIRPMFPIPTSNPTSSWPRFARYFDLAPEMPRGGLVGGAFCHLPARGHSCENVRGPEGVYADPAPVASGGRMIQRKPDDPKPGTRAGSITTTMPFDKPAILVHVVVRRLDRPEPGLVQPRTSERARRKNQGQPVRHGGTGHTLRLHARRREHCGG